MLQHHPTPTRSDVFIPLSAVDGPPFPLPAYRNGIRASAFKVDSKVAAPMKAFRVTGVMPFGSQQQDFTQDVTAKSKSAAEHIVLSILGSRHKASRRKIEIASIQVIDPKDSLDPKVQNHFRGRAASSAGEEEE